MLTLWDWAAGKTLLRSKAFSQEVFTVSFSPYSSTSLVTSGGLAGGLQVNQCLTCLLRPECCICSRQHALELWSAEKPSSFAGGLRCWMGVCTGCVSLVISDGSAKSLFSSDASSRFVVISSSRQPWLAL